MTIAEQILLKIENQKLQRELRAAEKAREEERQSRMSLAAYRNRKQAEQQEHLRYPTQPSSITSQTTHLYYTTKDLTSERNRQYASSAYRRQVRSGIGAQAGGSYNPTSGEYYGMSSSAFEQYKLKQAQSKGLTRVLSNIQEARSIHDEPNLPNKFFNKIPAYQVREYSTPPIAVFDVETDDFGRPITVTALKFHRDKNGKLQLIDSYQRYYSIESNLAVKKTRDIHGLSKGILKRLRREQGALYNLTYNKEEEQALQSFLSGTVFSGHNIRGYDISHLGLGGMSNNFVDTLDIARNLWPGADNSLGAVFHRAFGKSMEEMGLPHHLSNADTIATAMILEKMAMMKGSVGDEIRHVLRHRDRFYGPRDEMLGSSVYKGRGLEASEVLAMEELSKEISDDIVKNIANEGGMNYTDLGPSSSEDIGPATVAFEKLSLKIRDMYEKLASITQSATVTEQFASTLSAYKRGDWLRTISRSAYMDMPEVAEGLNVPRTDQSTVIAAARLLKEQDQKRAAFRELRGYVRRGLGDSQFVHSFREGLSSSWSDWSPDKIEQLERDEEYAQEREGRRKSRYLNRMQRSGAITDKQRQSLEKLTGTYDDLVDATDKAASANKRLYGTLQAIASIKPYDVNQYVNSARSQWGSTMGAAHSVVPSFILNPISRLGSATFNYADRRLSPFNAVQRVWNSGIGNVATGAMMAGGPVGIGIGATLGGINAATQIVGNYKQAKMEMAFLDIQNNLNTLGALISWNLTPFKLLHKATKLLIGSFSGLTLKLNSIMGHGIQDMAGMGNPLTELTGVNYAAYEGTRMMDVASLFSKGSMNDIYENFARQQKAFYTLGEVNTNRLIASSLLGVYSDVYSPSEDTAGQYSGMANKILRSMEGQSESQRARTMYLASEIDKNLPALLHTARLLDVSDVRELEDPSRKGMFWRPITDNEEKGFRWTQYEYGAATSQWSHTRMRLADKLWNSMGKDIYNGINRIADAVVRGDWKTAIDSAVEMWTNFKEKVVGAWNSIKDALNKDGEDNNPLKGIGETLRRGLVGAAKIVISVWSDIMKALIRSMQTTIAYLSTIKLKPTWKDGKLGFELETIKDVERISSKDFVYDTHKNWKGEYVHKAQKGARGYASLIEQLWPDMDDHEKAMMTPQKLINMLYQYGQEGEIVDGELRRKTLSIKEGLTNLPINSKTDAARVLDYLTMVYEHGGNTNWNAVAALPISGIDQKYWTPGFADTTGIGDIADKLIDTSKEATFTALDIASEDAKKFTMEFKFTDTKTGKTVKASWDNLKDQASQILRLDQMVPKDTSLQAVMYND